MNQEIMIENCAGCAEELELNVDGFCISCAELLEETCISLVDIDADFSENLAFALSAE